MAARAQAAARRARAAAAEAGVRRVVGLAAVAAAVGARVAVPAAVPGGTAPGCGLLDALAWPWEGAGLLRPPPPLQLKPMLQQLLKELLWTPLRL